MTKLNLSRRQFINVTAASSGLYAMTGMSNLVLGETPKDVGLKNARVLSKNDIPYIGMTDEGQSPGEQVERTRAFSVRAAKEEHPETVKRLVNFSKRWCRDNKPRAGGVENGKLNE